MSCHHPRTPEWAQLYSEARVQFEEGDLFGALNKAQKGFAESAQIDPIWNWKFRILKAEILLWQNRSGEVLSVLAAAPPQELSSGEFAVRSKAAVAMALVTLHRYEEAEPRFKEADEVASRSAPQMRCEVILFEGNEAYRRAQSAGADNALRKQQYAIAEQQYQLALQLAQQYQQPYIEVGALFGLGITLTGLDRFDEAIDRSLQSLDLARIHRFKLAENYAVANLAWSYAQLGDQEKAISNFLEEVKVIDRLNQPNLKEHLFNNLGETYLAQGRYPAARESFLEALNIARDLDRKKSSDEKPTMVFALANAAMADLEENNLQEAERYSREASEINSSDPRVVLILAKIAVARHDLTRAASLLRKLVGAQGAEPFIYWDAEAELARVFVAQHQKRHAETEFEKVIDEIEAARTGLQVVENRLAFSSHARRVYADYVRFLVATGQQRKAFQVAEFSRARTLQEGVGIKAPGHPSDVSIARVQTFLRKHNQVALAYWLAPTESFAWLITPSDFQPFTLKQDREIDQEADEYNRLLQGTGNSAQLELKGQSLYQELISPVEKLIPDGASVVVIPDGGLSKVNFETLRISHPVPHYWIRDVEIEVASSTSLLINSRKRDLAQQRKLLLIGNPTEVSNDYPALTHAEEELKRVAAHFTSDEETVISGKGATPSIYRSSHPENFAVIDFVTHGTAHELSPLESAIILSPQAEKSFKLYARDVVNIPINADLVVVSACYGVGKRAYSGEGLVGLAWAFLRAGAHQVVAGLWDVDDRASVELMDDFYTELQKTKSASAALRAAKLKMEGSSGSYRRPYYWAPLQVYTGS